MRSKNSRMTSVKPGKAVVSPEVTFVQILAGGEYVRVLVPGTGNNVHARTGSAAVAEALSRNVADGYGERMLAGLPAGFPQVRAVVEAAVYGAAVAA